MFDREAYYSITEIRKMFRVSDKAIDEILTGLPVITKDVDLGLYKVVAKYYTKIDIDALRLPRKSK